MYRACANTHTVPADFRGSGSIVEYVLAKHETTEHNRLTAPFNTMQFKGTIETPNLKSEGQYLGVVPFRDCAEGCWFALQANCWGALPHSSTNLRARSSIRRAFRSQRRGSRSKACRVHQFRGYSSIVE